MVTPRRPSPRINRYQVSSTVLLLFSVAVFCGLYAPRHPTSREYAAIVCAGVVHVLLVALGLATAISDPSDPGVSIASMQNCKYCSLCVAHVEFTSKHCRTCSRCTAGFDHHCVWLNNCIGRTNYKYFVALLATLQAVSVVYIFVGLETLSRICDVSERSRFLVVSGSQKYGGPAAAYAVVAAACAVMAAWVLVFALNGYLLVLQIYLRVNKKTSYEFFLSRRRRARWVTPSRTTSPVSLSPSPLVATSDEKTASPDKIAVTFLPAQRRVNNHSADDSDWLDRSDAN